MFVAGDLVAETSGLERVPFVRNSSPLEHRVVVLCSRRNRLNHIPVLHYLAILHSEKINHCITAITRAAHPVAMKNHQVSIRERSLDLHVRLWIIGVEPGDKLCNTFPAICNYGGMLRIGLATVPGECALGVKVVNQLADSRVMMGAIAT
jgi:hypothetical protein